MKPATDALCAPEFEQFAERLREGQPSFTRAEIVTLLDVSEEVLDRAWQSLAIEAGADGAYSLDDLFAISYRLDNQRARQLRHYALQHLLGPSSALLSNARPSNPNPLTPSPADAPEKLLQQNPSTLVPPLPPLNEFKAVRRGIVQSVVHWLLAWVDIAYFAVLMLVLTLSPSAYNKANVYALLRLIYTNVWQVLPWFMVLCSLFSLVLIQIVIVSAASYGLSQYALEMVVRVLVLELIPLGTALFVIFGPSANNVNILHQPSQPNSAFGIANSDASPIRQATSYAPAGRASTAIALSDVPGVVAQSFAVVTMAALSSVLALFIAYLLVYGFSPWGIEHYTRMVGRVFNLAVSIIFSLKIVLFSLAVALVPLACARQQGRSRFTALVGVPQGTIRLFSVLVLIEIASLAIRYI
jgi:phospholipid/cholesterol/gamma-HCH transport system permease protein